jgi:hypothetical protein
MTRVFVSFAAGIIVGSAIITRAGSQAPAAATPAQTAPAAVPASAPGSPVVQLRLYTINRGRLDDFAAAWRSGVYPLRTRMGYRIPFAAKIPATNQFVWLIAYDGPETFEKKEQEYYASSARTGMTPDPAQLIARPDTWPVTPVVGWPPATP